MLQQKAMVTIILILVSFNVSFLPALIAFILKLADVYLADNISRVVYMSLSLNSFYESFHYCLADSFYVVVNKAWCENTSINVLLQTYNASHREGHSRNLNTDGNITNYQHNVIDETLSTSY